MRPRMGPRILRVVTYGNSQNCVFSWCGDFSSRINFLLLCAQAPAMVRVECRYVNGEFGEARAELARGARPYGEAS